MRSRVAGRGRQMDGEGAAPARFADHLDPAPMDLDNMFDDGQPQAGAAQPAAAGLVHPVKTLEEPGQSGGGDALALIAHRD